MTRKWQPLTSKWCNLRERNMKSVSKNDRKARAIMQARDMSRLGHGQSDIVRKLRDLWPSVSERTIYRWADRGIEQAGREQSQLVVSDRGMDKARDARIAELYELASDAREMGYKCFGGRKAMPDMSKAAAQEAARACTSYWKVAANLFDQLHRLSHHYVIPPERDLEQPEVRQLVAHTVAANAEAFEVSLLDEMMARLEEARERKLQAEGVTDLAARRNERSEVL